MDDLTYAVRVLNIEKRRNSGGVITSHRVLWKLDERLWKESFRTGAQADAFRSELLTAARRGEAFRRDTGRPVSWARRDRSISWYTFTLAYAEAKWSQVSPNHRRGIAEAL